MGLLCSNNTPLVWRVWDLNRRASDFHPNEFCHILSTMHILANAIPSCWDSPYVASSLDYGIGLRSKPTFPSQVTGHFVNCKQYQLPRRDTRKVKWNSTSKVSTVGLPWWSSCWESAWQCRAHGFNPWSGKILHATRQLSLCATTTDPESRALKPQLLSPLAATTEAREPRAQAPQ